MSHPKTPPSLPTIVDEAGDTPNWVPVLGLALFALFALVTAARFAMKDTETTTAPAAEQPAAPQPAEPTQ